MYFGAADIWGDGAEFKSLWPFRERQHDHCQCAELVAIM